jgi:hypothetical protein
MTITITLPNPAPKQRLAAAKTTVLARVEHARYERGIRKSQRKIGPYTP